MSTAAKPSAEVVVGSLAACNVSVDKRPDTGQMNGGSVGFGNLSIDKDELDIKVATSPTRRDSNAPPTPEPARWSSRAGSGWTERVSCRRSSARRRCR